MKLSIVYSRLLAKITSVQKQLADPNTDYKDRVSLSLELKSLELRHGKIAKLMASRLTEEKELAILDRHLSPEAKKQLARNYAETCKMNYHNYLLKGGNEKLPPEERVSGPSTAKLTLEEYEARIQKVGGQELLGELKPHGHLSTLPLLAFEDVEKDLIDDLDREFSEDEREAIEKELNAIVPVTHLEKEDATEKVYTAGIEKIKANMTDDDMPLKANGKPCTKEEAAALLNFVNDALAATKPGVDLDEARSVAEGIQEEVSGKYGKDYIDRDPTRKAGVELESGGGKRYIWKGPTKEGIAGFKALHDVDCSFPEDYKENFAYVVQRLDEINEVKPGLSGEQGTKSYGFTKLANLQTALAEAIEKGDPKTVLSTAAEYRKTYVAMKELCDFIKDKFSRDPVLYSGNVDVARNKSLPFEFRRDIATASRLNSCYIALIYAKNNGITIDELLERGPKAFLLDDSLGDTLCDPNAIAKQNAPHPVMHLENGKQVFVNKAAVTDTVTGPRSLGEMLRFACSTELAAQVGNIAVDHAAFRMLDGLVKNCPDRNVRDQNYGAMMSIGILKQTYAKYETRAQLLQDPLAMQNLLFMPEDEIDYVKAIPGAAVFNPKTYEIESGKFDIFEHLSKSQVDFKEFSEKLRTTAHDFFHAGENISAQMTSGFVGVLQSAAIKLLVAKADEKDQPGYAELRAFAADPFAKHDEWLTEWGLSFDKNDSFRYGQQLMCKQAAESLTEILDDPKPEETLSAAEKEMKNALAEKEKTFKKDLKSAPDKAAKRQEFIASLEEDFKKGKITEYYLKARTAQLESGEKVKELPSLFRIDDFPKRKHYVPNLTDEEKDGLTKDDIDILYERDKARAEEEKKLFLRRHVMESAGLAANEEHKLADAPIPVMSETVLRTENGFQSVAIDDFYRSLEDSLTETQALDDPAAEVEAPATQQAQKSEEEITQK